MYPLKRTPALVFAALAILSSGIEHAHANPDWTITGTTPQGGNIVTGSTTALPPLGPGGPYLSGAGFDRVTIEPDAVIPATSTAVEFQTAHDSITNFGTVNFTDYGFLFDPAGANTGDTVINSGAIVTTGGGLQSAIYFNSGSNSANSVKNLGVITITSGGNFVVLSATAGNNSNNSITNAGTFTSNAQGSVDGVELLASDGSNINNRILNSGSLGTGGGSNLVNVQASAGNSGNTIINSGIITTNLQGGSTMVQLGASTGNNTGNLILNSGSMEDGANSTVFLIAAGSGSNIGNTMVNSGLINTNGGAGNNPMEINTSGGSNTGNTMLNSGIIETGVSATAIELYSGGNGNTNNIAANTGSILLGDTSYGILLQAGAAGNTGNTVTNSGVISTGNGGSSIDIYFVASANNSNNIVNNTGVLVAGNSGNGVYFNANADNTGNTVTNLGNITNGNGGLGVYFYSAANNTGNTVINRGNVTSGSAGGGIYFVGINNTTNNSVTNWGNIAVGSGGGYGIYLYAGASNSGNTVTNWGSISAAGTSGTAILFQGGGGGNAVNLMGHSSVSGVIAATGGAHNVLNLDFSGLSPAAQAALKAQISAQGNLNNFTGTFTVRGVTYKVDPMAIGFNMSSYQLQGITPNQAAIGASLDSAAVNPPLGSALYNLFNAIDLSGNVPGALEQLSPQKFQIYGDLAIANANFLSQSIDARLNNIRDGSESIDTGGIGGTTVAGLAKDDTKESKEIQATTPTPNRWGFFATGNGLFFRGNPNDADAVQGKANAAGTLAGVDAKVGDHGLVGALFSYENSAVALDSNNSQATIESYAGGLYGSWHDDGFYVNSLAAYTRNDYSSLRNIVIPGFAAVSNGSTNGNQATVNLDGGYQWNATNRLALGPLLDAQYVHLGIDGFNESGAGPASLAIGSENMNSLQTCLGAAANYHLLTSANSSFAADFHAAWQHEYLDDARGIDASFEGAGLFPFSVRTASPLRDAAALGAGVNFTFKDRLTLFAEYELEFWRASYFEQTINAGARISF